MRTAERNTALNPRAGQEIASIDTTSYEALFRQATANLAKTKATALNAEQNLRRAEQLRKSNISSASDLDAATAAAEQARAEVKAAEAAEAVARLNVERSRVKAPFEAAVADRVANAGDYVKAGAPLFRIVNDNVLKYIVQAPERYAGRVRKEQPVIFAVDAWPGETFQGKVFLISPAVSTATRSFPFGALVKNQEHKLKANTYARGQLILERNVPTPVVPIDAVVIFAGITKVFVLENGVARTRLVDLGKVMEGQQEVLSGLKGGEIVIASGLAKVEEGTKVRIKPMEAAPPARPPKPPATSASKASS